MGPFILMPKFPSTGYVRFKGHGDWTRSFLFFFRRNSLCVMWLDNRIALYAKWSCGTVNCIGLHLAHIDGFASPAN